MELSNDLGSYSPSSERGGASSGGVEVLLTLLTPIAPHICEELWEMTGNEGFVSERPWPSLDESALAPDRVTVVFQVNGKVREQVDLPAGMTLEEMQQAVLDADAVKRRLADKEVVRVIAVPDKLVNVVVKGQA